jgi:hypothetical protein
MIRASGGQSMTQKDLWRPYTKYELGETAIITWGRYDAVLTCEQPGKTEGQVPQRPQVGPKDFQGYETLQTRIKDGTVEWSCRVRPRYKS